MTYHLIFKRLHLKRYLVVKDLYYLIIKVLLVMSHSLIRLSTWLLWVVSILFSITLQLQFQRVRKVTLVMRLSTRLCQTYLRLLRNITSGLELYLIYGKYRAVVPHSSKVSYLAWMISKALDPSSKSLLILSGSLETWLTQMKLSETRLSLSCLKAAFLVRQDQRVRLNTITLPLD